MSSIKNTNQKVSKKYADNFDLIFGECKTNFTGTYVYDEKSRSTFLIDKKIPNIIRNKMEKRTEQIRDMKPITIKKKRVAEK